MLLWSACLCFHCCCYSCCPAVTHVPCLLHYLYRAAGAYREANLEPDTTPDIIAERKKHGGTRNGLVLVVSSLSACLLLAATTAALLLCPLSQALSGILAQKLEWLGVAFSTLDRPGEPSQGYSTTRKSDTTLLRMSELLALSTNKQLGLDFCAYLVRGVRCSYFWYVRTTENALICLFFTCFQNNGISPACGCSEKQCLLFCSTGSAGSSKSARGLLLLCCFLLLLAAACSCFFFFFRHFFFHSRFFLYLKCMRYVRSYHTVAVLYGTRYEISRKLDSYYTAVVHKTKKVIGCATTIVNKSIQTSL